MEGQQGLILIFRYWYAMEGQQGLILIWFMSHPSTMQGT